MLVLSRDTVISVLGEVTIAPITSTIREIPSEVLLGTPDGMPRECVINLDHLQTVAKSKLGAVVTTLDATKLLEVRSALLFALGWF